MEQSPATSPMMSAIKTEHTATAPALDSTTMIMLQQDQHNSKAGDPRSIFKLHKEIRNRVWFFALRPDCMFMTGPNVCLKPHAHREKDIDRLKVLVLCSTIYNETVVLVRNNGEVVVQLNYRGPPVFHDDNPYKSPSGHPIPSMGELQFRGLRKIALIVHLGQINSPHGAMLYRKCSARSKLRDVLRALKAMHGIQSLRLFVERRSDRISTAEDWQELFDADRENRIPRLMLDVVREVARQGGEITVGRAFLHMDGDSEIRGWKPIQSHDDDPIIPWLLQSALREGIFVTRAADPPLRETMSSAELKDLLRDRIPDSDLLEYQFCGPITYEELADDGSVVPQPTTFGILESDIKDATELSGRRPMFLECRGCGCPFVDRGSLVEHLDKYTYHRTSTAEVEASRLRKEAHGNGPAGWAEEDVAPSFTSLFSRDRDN
jgi:hypothetical protein